jgi:hypothetical protein
MERQLHFSIRFHGVVFNESTARFFTLLIATAYQFLSVTQPQALQMVAEIDLTHSGQVHFVREVGICSRVKVN